MKFVHYYKKDQEDEGFIRYCFDSGSNIVSSTLRKMDGPAKVKIENNLSAYELYFI